ncbi:MAG TPA: flavodoxin family protein [Candidatus Methanoculleus thermohydrogenotrophicum]|jgi:multimeric flavodoxin WrbA|nr:flavodoxin family protein [Candidatus Methanoculleus thermohydrogenotrophicum]NLM81519.1 flavodoxin family protein [Candidatus Methanoculleus thermohydrogenotrophicum]HOB17649.1 flavodoxin family protein [Candidatus Methanoculleus thermohydrogenotrophicum]HPZ37329.1 flavodoxin family protein [Candidatus Methanoculleus thermohydrogenotrophicum]HQC91152.1 flavodoxin family protein [Candidatus Methanoculleus thermohydrogenotrophicum]
MKVLGISGSMRRTGNTALLVTTILDRVREAGIETEYLSLAGMDIRPCTGCEACKEAKWCVTEDDDWAAVAEKMINCEVLVLGAPTYYYDINGQTKNLIDRTYSLYHDRRLAGRKAVGVAVCSDRGCERALETIEGFLNSHEFSYLGYVCGKGYAPGEVRRDEWAMKQARQVANKIIRYLQPDD